MDAVDLRKTVEQLWAGQFRRPADAPVFHVARAPFLPSLRRSGRCITTLAAAVAAAPAGRLSVVEIDDDGPLFETPVAFADRSLIDLRRRRLPAADRLGRAALADRRRQARPLRRRARRASPGKPGRGLHPRDAAAGGLALLDAGDADLWADGCTFSAAGKPHEPTVVARFHGTRADAALCRFSRCYVRGPAVTAVDVDAPGAEVLFDGSLVVGGDAPLIQVRASDARATFLTAVRSTLVCGRTLLNIRRASDADHKPSVAWMGWDCLLSRSSDQADGDMVRAPSGDGVNTSGIQWRAYNCLYAGWKNLLAGPETVVGGDTIGWRAHWGRVEGDTAVRGAWPPYSEDPSVLPASAYRTADTPVGFAATAAPDGPLGCDPADLPWTRDDWRRLAAQEFVMPQFNPITADAPPAVNPADDGLYHGGRIDLSQPNVDLGAILHDYAERRQLAPRVVLLLSGAGEHPITPFRLRGCSLVLYADPPKEDAAPVTLTWAGQGSVGQDGLIEIEDGGLDLVNVGVKLADFPFAAAPEYALKVRGQLRLFRCRLEGPQQNLAEPYRGLIDLQGSGDPAPAAACASAINESVLVSGRDGVRLRGVGAWLLLRQSVLVAGGDALHLDPGPKWAGRANSQCVLDHVTVAARRSVVHLEDADHGTDAPPADPFAVRSRDGAFLNPFADKSGPSGMIAFEKSALAHGLLVWQGDGDAFSKRLTFAAAPVSALPDKEGGARPAWTRLWGSYGDDHPAADVTPAKPFDAPPWPLDRLALPKPKDARRRPAPTWRSSAC